MQFAFEFVQSGAGDDFYQKLFQEVQRLDEKFNFMAYISKYEKFEDGILKGLPISVKDCICVSGMESCAGSQILKGYKPTFDATCVARLKKAGCLIIGKTVQDEFGFGTFCINTSKIPKNPYDPERTCGGSSGGAAGLTSALNMPHVALAQSTGGSISCPASFCGVCGLTPTYGLVSRFGLIDYASSLDKIGIIAKCVRDIALILPLIAGKDEKDQTSIEPRDLGLRDIEKAKIGLPKEYFSNIDEKVEKKVRSAIEKLDFEIEEFSLPLTEYALPAYYIIACCEASTNLAKYCGMRYGVEGDVENKNMNEYFAEIRSKYFGTEAKRRILLGTFARTAGWREKYYVKALKLRTLIIKEFKEAFKKFDALLTPTMPILPPRFDEIAKLKPIEHYMMDVLTVGPNLAGIPHISVPCGFVEGLPVGMHLLSDHLNEGKLLSIALRVEECLKKY